MTAAVTIGVDVGTTRTKAVAFDADGLGIASANRPTRLERLSGDRYEHDMEAVVGGVFESVAELTASLGQVLVEAVGITGQGDGLWLVDDVGRPVRRAMSWLDGRSASIVAEWTAAGISEQIFRHNGSLVFPGSSGPLLAWLERHEPASLDAAATAGYSKDVVLQRLTGLRATDPSDASLPFFDHRTRTYDADLLELTGLAQRAGLLAEVHELPRGLVTDEAAELTGLAAGLPVVAAPYDLVASAIGAGVSEVGDGLLIVGTTLACEVVADRVETGGDPAGLTLATPDPGRWLRAMPAMVGTAALDWALGIVQAGADDLSELLAASSPGAGGVLMLPFLAGERAPFLAPQATGRLDGLRLGTTAADLVRAVCEALAYSARHCFEAGGLAGSVTACGGGAASYEWRQIFADVLGRPIHYPAEAEVGARGAAAVARRVIGLPPLPPCAAETVEFDAAADEYAAGYARYLALIERARPEWGLQA